MPDDLSDRFKSLRVVSGHQILLNFSIQDILRQRFKFRIINIFVFLNDHLLAIQFSGTVDRFIGHLAIWFRIDLMGNLDRRIGHDRSVDDSAIILAALLVYRLQITDVSDICRVKE